MKRLIIITIIILSSLAQAQTLKVVTSFSILEDLVKNVGGNRISIHNFVSRDGDPHSFKPSARDAKVLTEAKLVFVNGAGLEGPFMKFAQNTVGKDKIIELAQGLATRQLETDHDHGGFDPHIWWNPMNTIKMVNRIRNRLTTADPKGKTIYWNNASKYNQQLQNLDQWAKLEMKKIPVAKRKIVTNHDALGYLADRYGLKIIGTIIPSGSTKRPPSIKETVALIRLIQREKVSVIFVENTINLKLAQTIAQDTKASIAPALYTDALGAIGSSGETYLKAFKYNISTFVTALQ